MEEIEDCLVTQSMQRLSKPKNLQTHVSAMPHLEVFCETHTRSCCPFVDEQLIPEQAGFRPGNSCTIQLLNLMQFIADGYEEGLITGAAFIDLSAACEKVNNRILTRKLFEITQDTTLSELIQNISVIKQTFCVDLVGKCSSRWQTQQMGQTEEWPSTRQRPRLYVVRYLYKRTASSSQHKVFPIRR